MRGGDVVHGEDMAGKKPCNAFAMYVISCFVALI